MATLASLLPRSTGLSISTVGGCYGFRARPQFVQMLVGLAMAIALSGTLMAALDGITARTFSYGSEQHHAAIQMDEGERRATVRRLGEALADYVGACETMSDLRAVYSRGDLAAAFIRKDVRGALEAG